MNFIKPDHSNKLLSSFIFLQCFLFIAILFILWLLGSTITLFGIFIILEITIMILFYLSKKTTEPYITTPKLSTDKSASTKSIVILTIILSATYLFLLFIIKSSWLNGDEFVILHVSSLPLVERLQIAGGSYLHWVSRVGELICNIGGIHLNRWQIFIINPLVIISIPIALWKLLGNDYSKIASAKGLTFFIFLIGLLMAGNSIGLWKCYTNYAASANYLWPILFNIIFLSFYNPKNWHSDSTFFVFNVAIFTIGLIAGWGTECISVIVFPILVIFLSYRLRKKLHTPVYAYTGLMGYLWGIMLMFASPAHATRCMKAASFRSIQPEHMSFTEVFNWVSSLTPEKLDMLGAPNVSLHGIPLILHIYFLEPMAQIFWAESSLFTTILIILTIILLIIKKGNRKKVVLISLSSISLAWISASAYLSQSIPTEMSFVPPAFFIVAGISYHFLTLLKHSPIKSFIFASLIAIMALFNVVPSWIEAIEYKHYEANQYKLINQAINGGLKNINIPSPYTSVPENKLRLINFRHLSEDAQSYTNKSLSEYYGVDSIRITR